VGLIADNLFYSYPAGVAESVSALSGVSLSLERGSFLIVAGQQDQANLRFCGFLLAYCHRRKEQCWLTVSM